MRVGKKTKKSNPGVSVKLRKKSKVGIFEIGIRTSPTRTRRIV
jgi:hypothetical protein